MANGRKLSDLPETTSVTPNDYIDIVTPSKENKILTIRSLLKLISSELPSNGGLSAYEIAKTQGFSGTEKEWLESLKGEPGPEGPQGPLGSIGPRGPKGDTGTFDPNKLFTELKTSEKTVIGAINELYDLLQSISQQPDSVPCTQLTLTRSSLSFTSLSSTLLITAVALPSNTTDSIIWTSSNTSVATVLNGLVTPVSNGNCVIIAICGSKSATCDVNVNIATVVYHNVAYNLDNVTCTNTTKQVKSGDPYLADLYCEDDYELEDVQILMNNVDITDSVLISTASNES